MTASRQNLSRLDSEAWFAVQKIVERFEHAWQDGQKPVIRDFVPTDEGERDNALIELVHTDIEYQWQTGQLAYVEDYLKHYPELAKPKERILDLIRTEFESRSAIAVVSLDEYLNRFPEL